MIEKSPLELRIRNTQIFINFYKDALLIVNLGPYTFCNIQNILLFEYKFVMLPKLSIQNDKDDKLTIDCAIFFSKFLEYTVIVLKFH